MVDQQHLDALELRGRRVAGALVACSAGLTFHEFAHFLALARTQVGRGVEVGALLGEGLHRPITQGLRQLAQFGERGFEIPVAHVGQLHRGHDGVKGFVLGIWRHGVRARLEKPRIVRAAPARVGRTLGAQTHQQVVVADRDLRMVPGRLGQVGDGPDRQHAGLPAGGAVAALDTVAVTRPARQLGEQPCVDGLRFVHAVAGCACGTLRQLRLGPLRCPSGNGNVPPVCAARTRQMLIAQASFTQFLRSECAYFHHLYVVNPRL